MFALKRENEPISAGCTNYVLVVEMQLGLGIGQLLVHCRCTSCCGSVGGGAKVEID